MFWTRSRLRASAATTIFFVAVNLSSPGSFSASGAEPSPLTPIGAAKIDISPNYAVRLSGYGNRRLESQGVAQKIWAKALAIGGDSQPGPALIVTVENCGITPKISTAIASQLREKAGVKRERLAITVTHSHTAPCLTNWAPNIFGQDIPPDHQANIDRYTQELIDKIVDVSVKALANRRPGRLSWGKGQVGFAANRRVLKDGKWTGFGVQKDGPVDHSLPILMARDADHKLIAVVGNYACHCTTLGGDYNQIAGDWAGYAQQFIEEANPNCISLITIGCGADANPEPRASKLELCEAHGKSFANEVQRLLALEAKPLDSNIACKLTHVDLPFVPLPTKEQWQEAAKREGAPGYHAKKFLARQERGETIPTSLSYPVGVWTFGDDLAMVFLGGEVVVDYVLRLQQEFDADRLWVTAYSNDVCCYIPSKRILREGGYEAEFSMYFYDRPTRFADAAEDIICDTIQKLTPHTFYSPAKRADFPGPKKPLDGLKSLTVKAGFEVELVAAEPLIEDPVAFDWDAQGRMYVAEMRDYPNGMAWEKVGDPLGVAGGTVKLLTDTDGDGKYDHSSTFLANLPFPNGVKAWRNGVLITAAPQILYAEDTNGDGTADRTEVLFEGFVEGNQQHRVNGLRWGIDNWIYVANGDSGGTVRSTKSGASISIGGRDLRISPDDGRLETQSGQSQFGRCSDDWGNWFGCNNANPMYHFALDDHYLRRNPHLVPPAVRVDVPELPGTSPVFPTSQTLARFNDFHTANRFTSACSVEIYRDELLFGPGGQPSGMDGWRFAGHVFICEPVHNLVHHEELYVRGTSFRSKRSDDEQRTEFLSSSDNWFRPAMVRTGPDGALWVADMYRSTIEHPEWIPQVWQRKLDLRAGSDRGRIYRVFPQGKRPSSPVPLAQLTASRPSPQRLAAAIDSSNGWQREMIHQLLVWSNAKESRETLESLVKTAVRPQVRLHAACALDGLKQLSRGLVEGLLTDPHPGVRRQAIRLLEPFFSDIRLADPAYSLLERLVRDDDLLVRQQLSYSLGNWSDSASSRLLARLIVENASSPYVLAAAHSSLTTANLVQALAEARKLLGTNAVAGSPILRLVSMASGMGHPRVLQETFDISLANYDSQAPEASLSELTELLDAAQLGIRSGSSCLELLSDAQRQSLAELQRRAMTIAADSNLSDELRIVAIRLLTHCSAKAEATETLGLLVSPRNPAQVQAESIRTLTRLNHSTTPDVLLKNWNGLTPASRNLVLDTMLSRPSWAIRLLKSFQNNEVSLSQMDASRRQQLLQHANLEVRQQAASVLGAGTQSRKQILEQFQGVPELAGDTSRGKQIFVKRCSVCHKLEGVGFSVGPDLTSLTNRTPAAMMEAILDPNKAVEDKYLNYLVVTEDGRQFSGILTAETSASISLSQQEGKTVSVRRNEISELRSTGKSLMPEGVEKDLSKQEMADLLTYLREYSPVAKLFAGNTPDIAHVRDDGSIHMLAMNAKIFGPTLVYQEKYRSVGEWINVEDHVVWMLDVPKSGRYSVSIDYSCPEESSGNRFVLSAGEQELRGTIQATGSWEQFRGHRVGHLDLPQGRTELVLRSDGTIQGALANVRGIRLNPQ